MPNPNGSCMNYPSLLDWTHSAKKVQINMESNMESYNADVSVLKLSSSTEIAQLFGYNNIRVKLLRLDQKVFPQPRFIQLRLHLEF